MTPPASQDSSLPADVTCPEASLQLWQVGHQRPHFINERFCSVGQGFPCGGDPSPSFLQGWDGGLRQGRGYGP